MEMVAEKIGRVNAMKENLQHGFYQLETEIKSYPSDWKVWIREGDVRNSGGNLCLYLINLFQHAFDVVNRNETRDETKMPMLQLSRADLMIKIESVKGQLEKMFADFSDDVLDDEFPLTIRDKQVSTDTYLLYLTTELYYRTGQINYHRRLI